MFILLILIGPITFAGGGMGDVWGRSRGSACGRIMGCFRGSRMGGVGEREQGALFRIL